MIKIAVKFISIALILVLVGCQGGGITIPQSDSTPPTVTLSAIQPNGGSTTVSAGGAEQTLTLTAKTGSLNLTATAEDPQSGIQTLQIWVSYRTAGCENDICTSSEPGLQTKPRFESTSPQKKAGEKTVQMSILADALNLSEFISPTSPLPGSTVYVDVIITAKAVNHLGGQTITPKLTAKWKEP